jgi:hypothetical protein
MSLALPFAFSAVPRRTPCSTTSPLLKLEKILVAALQGYIHHLRSVGPLRKLPQRIPHCSRKIILRVGYKPSVRSKFISLRSVWKARGGRKEVYGKKPEKTSPQSRSPTLYGYKPQTGWALVKGQVT